MGWARRIGGLGLLLAAAWFAPAGPAAAQTGPTVFAAASLKNALDEIAAGWTAGGRTAPRLTYAASNTLARQIEQGAPADLFFSADLDWMDHLGSRDMLRPGTRTNLLSNAIVLIAPRDSAVQLSAIRGMDLAGALGGGRLAMGHVDAVPAGKYGRAALEHLGAWDGVRDRVAQAESVRAALLLVSRGEAPLGIVYATDAVSEPGVTVVARFPADSHPPIVYPAARTRDSANAAAAALLGWLRGPAARPFFEREGFTVIGSERRS